MKKWTEQDNQDLLYAWHSHNLDIQGIANLFDTSKVQIISQLLRLGAFNERI